MAALLHFFGRTLYAIDGSECRRFPSLARVDDDVFKNMNTAYMLGTRRNLMYLPDLMDAGLSVSIGTPSELPNRKYTRGELVDAAIAVDELPVEFGGWRVAEERDYHLGKVLKNMITESYNFEVLRVAASKLPIWKYLSFIDGIKYPAMHILANYFDPRWYTHINAPNRIGKFKAYAGFHLIRKRGVWMNPTSGYNVYLKSAIMTTLCPGVVRPNSEEFSPNEFLRDNWFWYYQRLKKQKSQMDEISIRKLVDVKIAQRFLAYLCFLWRDCLNNTTYFDPRIYFHRECDIEAFKALAGPKYGKYAAPDQVEGVVEDPVLSVPAR